MTTAFSLMVWAKKLKLLEVVIPKRSEESASSWGRENSRFLAQERRFGMTTSAKNALELRYP
jgi:hypothetical protein